MSGSADHRVLGLGQLCLQRRTHIRCCPQGNSSDSYYVVEDVLRGKYFRLGAAEYELLQRLDGTRTLRQVIADVATEFGSEGFNEQDAYGIAQWLVEQELADTPSSKTAGQQWKNWQQIRRGRWLAWNPLFIKMPLGNPDALLHRLQRLLGGIFTVPACLIWLLVVAVALLRVAGQLERFSQDSVGILAPHHWPVFLAAWVGLKIVHELAHGVACKQFGVPVRECGIIWVLFSPMAYVDATAAWRLPNKWQRIAVSSAGMYAELFLASLAAICWSLLTPGIVAHVCYQIIVSASISTLVFNANPFVRFDGYFVLSDGWEVPNLSVLSHRYTGYLFRRYLLGAKVTPPALPSSKAFGIKVYSCVAWIWRVGMMWGILIAAHRLFWGAGTILAFFAAAMWMGTPVYQWCVLIWQGKERPPAWSRVVTLVCGMVAVVWLMDAVIPWPGGVTAPALIEGQHDAILRAKTAGFVRAVLVKDDQPVEMGQELVRLENRELAQEVADLRLQIVQVESRRSDLRDQGDLAGEQSQQRFQEALEVRLRERETNLQELVLRAPVAGRVMSPLLDQRLGAFVEPGEEILRICGPEKQVRISVHQDDISYFQAKVGEELQVTPRSGPTVRAKLTEVQPHASPQVPNPALTVLGGGPLPVQKRPNLGPANHPESRAEYDLLSPRFVAIAQIAPESVPPRHGMLAQVRFFSARDTLGRRVVRWIQSWIDQRLGR